MTGLFEGTKFCFVVFNTIQSFNCFCHFKRHTEAGVRNIKKTIQYYKFSTLVPTTQKKQATKELVFIGVTLGEQFSDFIFFPQGPFAFRISMYHEENNQLSTPSSNMKHKVGRTYQEKENQDSKLSLIINYITVEIILIPPLPQ